MDDLTPRQLKKLEKLAKFADDKDISTFENLLEIDEKVESLETKLENGLSAISEELKKKLDEELSYEIDPETIRGEKGVPGRNPLTVSDTAPVDPLIGDLWYQP